MTKTQAYFSLNTLDLTTIANRPWSNDLDNGWSNIRTTLNLIARWDGNNNPGELKRRFHDNNKIPWNMHKVLFCFVLFWLHCHLGFMSFILSHSSSGRFYQHGLTLIPALISDPIHYKVWDEIAYPSPNFNGCTVEVWEWVSNFTPHFTRHVITYPCRDLS